MLLAVLSGQIQSVDASLWDIVDFWREHDHPDIHMGHHLLTNLEVGPCSTQYTGLHPCR